MTDEILTLHAAETAQVVARLKVADRGVLSIEEASPEHARKIAGLVEMLNGLSSFRINGTPPPDARDHELFAEDVTREAEGLAEVIAQYIRERYPFTVTGA